MKNEALSPSPEWTKHAGVVWDLLIIMEGCRGLVTKPEELDALDTMKASLRELKAYRNTPGLEDSFLLKLHKLHSELSKSFLASGNLRDLCSSLSFNLAQLDAIAETDAYNAYVAAMLIREGDTHDAH